jgi:hypothetical protein
MDCKKLGEIFVRSFKLIAFLMWANFNVLDLSPKITPLLHISLQNPSVNCRDRILL